MQFVEQLEQFGLGNQRQQENYHFAESESDTGTQLFKKNQLNMSARMKAESIWNKLFIKTKCTLKIVPVFSCFPS